MSDPFPKDEGCMDGQKRNHDLSDVLKIIQQGNENSATRDREMRQLISDLTRRVQDIESSNLREDGGPVRFGPFGIFHKEPSDETYRLSLPLLIAMGGVIIGMLLTLV